MAVRNDFTAGEVLAAADLNDTFASKLDLAGGKILQIVRATDGSSRSVTSATFTDVTGASVTITPQKSDSAVIIIAVGAWRSQKSDDTTNFGLLRITDSSNNAISGTGTGRFGIENITGTSTRYIYGGFNIWAYATPATTSATTYKLQFRSWDVSNTFVVSGDLALTQLFAIEVSA